MPCTSSDESVSEITTDEAFDNSTQDIDLTSESTLQTALPTSVSFIVENYWTCLNLIHFPTPNIVT